MFSGGDPIPSIPQSLISGESGWTIGHTLSFVDDEVHLAGQVNLSTHLHGDAAPAFELVGAGWAVLDAAALVKVMLAGSTCHIVIGSGAAAQTLGMTALTRICARSLLTILWTHWRRNT